MTQPSPLILAFGDSLVAGYGLATADSFPAQLERRLRARRPAASVVNGGVSGDTTDAALRRLPRLLSGLTGRPDLAIVQVGPNDVLRGVAPERTRANLETMLTEFARCGIRVLLATVTPPAFLARHAAGHVGIHDAVAARLGVATCAFFPAGVLGHPAMVLADRVHPNARAIAAVVDHMLPAIERLLSERAAAA